MKITKIWLKKFIVNWRSEFPWRRSDEEDEMGGPKFEVPDWRQYKVEGVPELERLQRLLATHNLKDPWIRNEVWRFHPKEYSSRMTNMRKSVFRGFKYAVAAMVVTIAVEQLQAMYQPPKDPGHH